MARRRVWRWSWWLVAAATVCATVAVLALFGGWRPTEPVSRLLPVGVLAAALASAAWIVLPGLDRLRRLVLLCLWVPLLAVVGMSILVMEHRASENGPASADTAGYSDHEFINRGVTLNLLTGNVTWHYDNEHGERRGLQMPAVDLARGFDPVGLLRD